MKLMVIVLSAGIVGGLLLGLRHRRLHLMHEMTRMHTQMEEDRKAIWRHQVIIGKATAPPYLMEKVRTHKLALEPVWRSVLTRSAEADALPWSAAAYELQRRGAPATEDAGVQ